MAAVALTARPNPKGHVAARPLLLVMLVRPLLCEHVLGAHMHVEASCRAASAATRWPGLCGSCCWCSIQSSCYVGTSWTPYAAA